MRHFFVAFLLALPVFAQACEPHIEVRSDGTTASFRPHTSDFEHCLVDEETYRQVTSQWLQARPADSPELKSLFLGRAVSFPWVSRQLADTALQRPDWAVRMARTKPWERHRLAAETINDPAIRQRLDAAFAETRYKVVGISFEKVLFGKAGEYSSNPAAGKVPVPFDAQLWLRLAPRQ